MNGYKAFYDGKSIEVHAESSYRAQRKAVEFFKPPKRKEHLVHVVLCERSDGSTVIHKPQDVCS